MSEQLVLGAGAWGTALALLLARNKHQVHLWDIDPQLIQSLYDTKCNQRYLPGILLPGNIHPVRTLNDVPSAAFQQIISAVPCHGLRSSLEQLPSHSRYNICLAGKGLEPNTQKLNHIVVQETLDCPVAILSGPSFAKEVALGFPTAVTIAAMEQFTAKRFANLFRQESFRVYTHTDYVGVQIGGAVKNVIAIAAGIVAGLGYAANTHAALITRGLAEICRLGLALGARSDTFMGLSGLGDLTLTCGDPQSRNRRFGMALAQGKSITVAQKEIGQVIEGIQTAVEVKKLATQYNVDMPITDQIVKIINTEITPKDAVQSLLMRPQKTENKD